MLDRIGKEAFVMLAAVALAYVAAGELGAEICAVLAFVIALVLWTPVRRWLGIPSRTSQGQESPPPMIGGVRNHPGARSTHIRSRFKHGTGIENLPGNADQPGGESYDKESTFE